MSAFARVAIVGGTGALGFGLAARLARAGVEVVIGSRGPAGARVAADRIRLGLPRAAVSGQANAEAVQGADLVVLAVPFAAQAPTLKGLAKVLQPGQVVLDTTVSLATAVGGSPTRLLGVPAGSAAEQARSLLPPGVELVAGLHTVAAASLADLDHVLDEDVLLCGDDRAATGRVAALLAAIPGLRPVDCGALPMARHLESLTPLLIAVNSRHKVTAGFRVLGAPACAGA